MRTDVRQLLDRFRRDRTLWAEAPCGHAYRLVDGPLFHDSEMPPEAMDFVKAREEAIADLRKRVAEYRVRLTTGFVAKSVSVKLGKTLEKVAPHLPGFPYAAKDCRPMFEPVDYVAFVGLSKGPIDRVDLVDIKTGAAQLNPLQRAIRDVVQDGNVSMERI